MLVEMDIALWLDLPAWALTASHGLVSGHWQFALEWVDVSLTLVCY